MPTHHAPLPSCAAFVINHSHEYTLAAITSWAEFWLELLLFPSLKRSVVVAYSSRCINLAWTSVSEACRSCIRLRS
jgi:hypothetical protein